MCTGIGSPGLRAFSKILPALKQLETLTLDFQMCTRIGQTGWDSVEDRRRPSSDLAVVVLPV